MNTPTDLRAAREASGLTLTRVAILAHRPIVDVDDYERDGYVADPESERAIAGVYDVLGEVLRVAEDQLDDAIEDALVEEMLADRDPAAAP